VKVTPTVHVAPAATLDAQVLLARLKFALVAILVKIKDTFARFVSVTVLAALVLPITIVPRFKELGERVTCAVPDPVSATVCVPALSTIVSALVNDPIAVGVNVTEIVQDAPAARLAPQVLVWLNGADAVTLETCNGAVPEFSIVTVLAVLVAPSTCDEKPSDAGETEAPGAVPVPESATVCMSPAFPE